MVIRSTSTRLGAVGVTGVLLLGLVACGDDDDPVEDTTDQEGDEAEQEPGQNADEVDQGLDPTTTAPTTPTTAPPTSPTTSPPAVPPPLITAPPAGPAAP